MAEIPTPEHTPRPTHDQVLSRLADLVAKGYTSPDRMDQSDPEVVAAEAFFYAWVQQQKASAAQSPVPGADIEASLSASTAYIDAGFTDPIYLEDVASDLTNEAESAAERGLTELAARIEERIDAITAQIEQTDG